MYVTTYIVYDEYNQFTSTMYPSTPIAALKSESGLIPAHILLDFWQRRYACRLQMPYQPSSAGAWDVVRIRLFLLLSYE